MSLIEVLVAILVAALGIMSMLAMQINATKYTKTSEVRALGTLLIGDLADRMRANQAGFIAGNYASTPTYPANGLVSAPDAVNTCNAATSTCSPADMAAQDLNDWRRAVNFALPNGYAAISPAVSNATTGQNAADVWIVWLDPQGDKSFDNGATECPAAAVSKTGKDGKASLSVTPRCMHFLINI
jgi:type IV pilus assembly protein PilV